LVAITNNHLCRYLVTTTSTYHRSIVKMSDAGEQKSFTLQTASFDARFPNQNQTKHCWQK